MIRCFTAILPPDTILDGIESTMNELRAAFRDANIPAPKWERRDNLHCTLNFFGNVEEPLVETLVQHSSESLAPSSGSLSLSLHEIGTFPHARHPRILWIGLEGDIQRLAELQLRLGDRARDLGMPAEARAFHPHITIGRWNAPPRSIADAISGAAVPATPFTVHSIAVMRSVTRPEGAEYACVGRIGVG